MTAYDIVVVGGGIFGLSVAKAAHDLGLKVALLEKNTIASGASAGLVGALMPHVPSQWNEKKQFQLEALIELSVIVNALEEATGLSVGYSRTGRLIPLYTEAKLEHALSRVGESLFRWRSDETGFTFNVLKETPFSDWLTPEAAPLGFIWDTLAARANPRLVSAGLHTFLKTRVDIMEHTEFLGFDEASGQVSLGNGETMSTDRLVLSAGYEGFEEINKIGGKTIGIGVKGQSVLLEYTTEKPLPVIYDEGIYVVAHANGTVAIGSTSEQEWTTKEPVEADIQAMLTKAIAFCPSLKDAPVIGSWAGIRPKCKKRDPLVGLLPGKNKTWVATGGFKISYAISHRIAACLMQEMFPEMEKHVYLPDSFKPAFHFG
ncbi:FAD-dependent oxidoreductase [Pseudovibrio sp. Tun.PSC04-5.I4]|uniref:NAD(P)/FAD-dependent oxidoreductase n=1 Tax=Pseudovibrio sp. Tun.PSC04-5.I4 TaxID=1798213 RepID=UPI00088C2410|nr:FAD-dependent oxidoreductase [Pseudovibrio sp. Tun.PSC04-5.I4]SDR28643.1 Glycine/D-amino acid oxidase [Pseudovibrio sp. Tun.PSC04-5.I4]